MNSKTRILLSRAGVVQLCARDRRVIARAAQRARETRALTIKSRRHGRIRAFASGFAALVAAARTGFSLRGDKPSGAGPSHTSTWRPV